MNKIIYTLWKSGYSNSLHTSSLDLLKNIDQPVNSYCDLGCGDGSFLNKVAQAFNPSNVVGCDIYHRLVNSKATFISHDLNTLPLPFENGQFDLITNTNVIEHLFNPDEFIKEIFRILKPGGSLLISTNNISCWTNILSLVFGRQPNAMHASDYGEFGRFLQKDSIRKLPEAMHRRLFSMSALKNVCKFHGFINPVGRYCVFYPFSGLLERGAERLLSIYSAYIVLLVKKPL
jgi:SAM-dependent methyltransferase